APDQFTGQHHGQGFDVLHNCFMGDSFSHWLTLVLRRLMKKHNTESIHFYSAYRNFLGDNDLANDQ
ncbi:MAG TPA: hypothetical protein PLZ51_00180, partial [Aggregatilineales bacterium]|nr:hypothetical protein [Aggregatilineales bacterium]